MILSSVYFGPRLAFALYYIMYLYIMYLGREIRARSSLGDNIHCFQHGTDVAINNIIDRQNMTHRTCPENGLIMASPQT